MGLPAVGLTIMGLCFQQLIGQLWAVHELTGQVLLLLLLGRLVLSGGVWLAGEGLVVVWC